MKKVWQIGKSGKEWKRGNPEFVCADYCNEFLCVSFAFLAERHKDSIVMVKPIGTNEPWLCIPEGSNPKEAYAIAKESLLCR